MRLLRLMIGLKMIFLIGLIHIVSLISFVISIWIPIIVAWIRFKGNIYKSFIFPCAGACYNKYQYRRLRTSCLFREPLW